MAAQRHWVSVNRAPVLTLWAAVVAERLGFTRTEALTLGRAVAGLNAYAKGKSLGIFKPSKATLAQTRKTLPAGEPIYVELLGRAVPAVGGEGGLRAVSKGKPIDPASVERYLEGKFGEAYGETRAAMQELAKAHRPHALAERAYGLYTKFRPEIPAGKKGWGARGRLSLDRLRDLAAQ